LPSAGLSNAPTRPKSACQSKLTIICESVNFNLTTLDPCGSFHTHLQRFIGAFLLSNIIEPSEALVCPHYQVGFADQVGLQDCDGGPLLFFHSSPAGTLPKLPTLQTP
jgi:hypothetical protein